MTVSIEMYQIDRDPLTDASFAHLRKIKMERSLSAVESKQLTLVVDEFERKRVPETASEPTAAHPRMDLVTIKSQMRPTKQTKFKRSMRISLSKPKTFCIPKCIAFGDAVNQQAHPNGLYAVGTTQGQIILFDAASHRRLYTLTGPELTVETIAFSTLHPYLYVSGGDKLVRVFDLAAPQMHQRLALRGNTKAVFAIDSIPHVSSTGGQSDIVASAGDDGCLRCWDMADPTTCMMVANPTAEHASRAVHLLTFGNSTVAVLGSQSGTVRLYTVRRVNTNPEPDHAIKAHIKEVMDIQSFSVDGVLFIVSISHDRIIKWKINRDGMSDSAGTLEILHDLPLPSAGLVVSGSVSPDGIISVIWDSGKVMFIDGPSMVPVHRMKVTLSRGAVVNCGGFNQIGSRLLVGSDSEAVQAGVGVGGPRGVIDVLAEQAG